MLRKLKLIMGSFIVASAMAGAVTVAYPTAVVAQAPEESACLGSGGTWAGGNCTHGTRTVAGTFKTVGNILIFLTAAISVVMIIIGGLRYTLSNGEQGSITSAKNTILYAVIGVIVSIAAYAIVNFVLSNI